MATILEKIAKVLAKAENTDNEHEADAFLAHAQFLASKHSIDLAQARRHVAKSQQRETPTMRTIDIGAPRAVGNAKMVSLFLTIGRANDVKCNIAHNSTYVVAFGFPSDIEVAEALYAHLVPQMVQAANAYLKTGAFRDEVVYDRRNHEFRAPSARAARLSFYDAFISRIADRLAEAKAKAEQAFDTEVEGETTETSTSSALVLAEKKAEIEEFYSAKSTARGSWRGNRRSASTVSSSATSAGFAAGDRARLTATPTLPGGRQALAG